jgi:hypothetical protein
VSVIPSAPLKSFLKKRRFFQSKDMQNREDKQANQKTQKENDAPPRQSGKDASFFAFNRVKIGKPR